MTPRDHISTALVYVSYGSSPGEEKPITSGAANAGVPVRVRNAVSPSDSRLLIPKSAILTHQSGPLLWTNMFCIARHHRINKQLFETDKGLTAGFKSLCAKPLSCIKSRPSRT